MKTLFYSIFLWLSALSTYAQKENIIVLVDISGSVTRYNRQPTLAANAISDVILGKTIANTDYSLKLASGGSLTEPLTDVGKKIMIVPFGDKHTDYSIRNEIPESINSLQEVSTIINRKYPTSYPDQKTYRSLAIARSAEIAKRNGLTTYWLFIASDVTGDDFMGLPADYDANQQEVLDSYKSPANKIDEIKFGKINYLPNPTFQIDIINITLTNYTPPTPSPTTPTPVVDTVQQTCKITLNSFVNGTITKPREVTTVPFTLNWTCNCPNISNYRVTISPLSGSKIDNSLKSKTYTTNSAQYILENGKYRIVVAAEEAIAASTTIEVSTGSGGLFFIFLVLAGIAYAIYYWFSKKRERSPSTPKKTKSKDDATTHFD